MSTEQRRIPIIIRQWLAMLLALALLPSVGIVGAAAPIDKRLLEAASGGDLKTVKRLLQEGADINAKHQYGGPPLLEASEHGHVEVVKTLLARGADVNAKDDEGRTALMWALYRGHYGVEVMKALLDKGANVNAKAVLGWTALMLASKGGHVDVVKLLKAHGAKE